MRSSTLLGNLARLAIVVALAMPVVSCDRDVLGLGQSSPSVSTEGAIAQAHPTQTPTSAGPESTAPALSLPADTSSTVNVARAVRPAVVNIASEQMSYDAYLRPIPEVAGVGSGVLFDARGYIITNNHVVSGAQALKVSLPDGRSFDGKLVGADPRTDLAVVKIEGDSLPVAELGDSDSLEIGQWVVAIGNALALSGGPTVTAGVVGALGRSIETSDGGVLYDLVQTDAAINPGNSGGPLIDLNARVVGINTAIAQAPGAGIGFAIAINQAKPIVEALIAHGRVSRPWLGVGLANVTPALAARYGLPVNRGVIITRVVRGSPAGTAGLRQGDIIVAVDGSTVEDIAALFKVLDQHQVGDRVKLTIVREDGQVELEVTLEEMPTP